MTAAEVNTRTALIRQILGPIFGRLQAEFLEPLITRCFGLGFRDGDFGEPPKTSDGFTINTVNIAYRSPLANAQKQQQLDAIDQFEQRLVSKLQIQPELLDVYDMEESTRRSAELLGVDIDLIRDEGKVIQLRKKKQQQQAEQAAQAVGQAGIDPAQAMAALGGQAA